MTKPLIILGAAGNAHDVIDIIEAINDRCPTWSVLGFLDDDLPVGSHAMGLSVLGPLESAKCFPDCYFMNCIGSEYSIGSRDQIIARAMLNASGFATLIHPHASVSKQAKIGHGTYVSFGCSIGGGAVLGNHVSVAPGVIVGHDSQINDYAILAAGSVVSGFVEIGESTYVGARAVIKQRLAIGTRSLIGMGAVVTREVMPKTTVVGVPARPCTRVKNEVQVVKLEVRGIHNIFELGANKHDG